MSKKKGSGRGKNPELRGGKNTLPKTSTGKVDVRKVIKNGDADKKKSWEERVKPKAKPTKSAATINKKSTPAKKVTPTKKNEVNKGISRLKIMANKTAPSKSTTAPTKGIRKSTITVDKSANLKVTPQKAPVAKGISKLKVTANKAVPVKSPTTPQKATPTKGISKLKVATPKAKPIKAKAPKIVRKGR